MFNILIIEDTKRHADDAEVAMQAAGFSRGTGRNETGFAGKYDIVDDLETALSLLAQKLSHLGGNPSFLLSIETAIRDCCFIEILFFEFIRGTSASLSLRRNTMAKLIFTAEVEIPEDFNFNNLLWATTEAEEEVSGFFFRATRFGGDEGKFILSVDRQLLDSDPKRFELMAKALQAELQEG